MSKDIMKVITQVDFYGKTLNVYGLNKRDAYENPRFLAKEIANILNERDGYTVARKAKDNQKDTHLVSTTSDTHEVCSTSKARKTQEMLFISEEGLYRILAKSKNPIADQWLDEVTKVLKEYRLSYQDYIFTGQRFKSAKDHNELHDLIGDKGKCINLDKFLYNLCSYLLDLSEINRKDAIYQLKKSNITLYNQIMSSAYSYIKSYKRINKEHFIGITKEALLEEFVDDIDKYNEYISTHKVAKDEFIVQRGFGR